MEPNFTRIEVIDLARQLEACGEAWYDAARSVARAASVRSLLTELRDAEQAHARSFERLLSGVEQGSWRADEEYLRWMRGFVARRVFPDPAGARAAAGALSDDAELLRTAVRFEQQTIEFLEHLRPQVAGDERAVIDALIAEEQEHERALTARLR